MEQKMETFLTLCQTLHYGKAAERLHISQPAVSKHIQALEAQYQVKLFSYEGRRLHKTYQGELLERFAVSLRYNEEGLLAQLHQVPKTLLRIGATKSIGDYILLPEIEAFLSQPSNRLEFVVDNTAHLLRQLENGALDFLVVEGLFDKKKYDWFPFRQEPYVGICPKEHPFSGRKVELEELLPQRLILREKGSGTRRILEEALSQRSYTVDSFVDVACVSSFKIIKELVRGGFGISFLYESVVREEDWFGRFTCPPLTGAHEFNVVYLKDTNAGTYARAFLGF